MEVQAPNGIQNCQASDQIGKKTWALHQGTMAVWESRLVYIASMVDFNAYEDTSVIPKMLGISCTLLIVPLSLPFPEMQHFAGFRRGLNALFEFDREFPGRSCPSQSCGTQKITDFESRIPLYSGIAIYSNL